MSSQNGSKINQLLKEWPKGTVATQAKLSKLGISRQLATKYVLHNWIIRIGRGAFVRSGDQIDWRGGLYALQTQLGLSVHVGARIALELQGLSHFVPLGQQEKVNLISDRPERLPAWFRCHPWKVKLEHHCLSLFERIPKAASSRLECGGFEIVMSSPERAIMEQMRLVKVNDDVEQAYRLMEGLTTLRPSVVQDLLVNCRSVKVKRLFLWSAETIGHAWFGRLDLERVELGNGRRQLYKGGRLNLKYQITVPAQEELPGV